MNETQNITHPDNELIFKYANNEELSDSEKESVKKHLLECESCKKEYNSFAAMRTILTEYWDGKTDDCIDTETLAEYSEGLERRGESLVWLVAGH